MLYSIIGIDKQNSLQDRLAVRPAHVTRLQQLNDQGRLVLAGPNPAIDSPDPVRRVTPPSTTIMKTRAQQASSQVATWRSCLVTDMGQKSNSGSRYFPQ